MSEPSPRTLQGLPGLIMTLPESKARKWLGRIQNGLQRRQQSNKPQLPSHQVSAHQLPDYQQPIREQSVKQQPVERKPVDRIPVEQQHVEQQPVDQPPTTQQSSVTDKLITPPATAIAHATITATKRPLGPPPSEAEIKELLIAAGYNPRRPRFPKTPHTALAWASALGPTELVTTLLGRGASILPTGDADENHYFDGAENKDSWESPSQSSPLHRALEYGRGDIARLLIISFLPNGASGPEVEADVVRLLKFRVSRATALSLAARKGLIDVVAMLLDIGASPNDIAWESDELPLCEAAKFGHTDIVRLLLDHGADPVKRGGYDRRTPWEQAKVGRHTEAAAILWKATKAREEELKRANAGAVRDCDKVSFQTKVRNARRGSGGMGVEEALRWD